MVQLELFPISAIPIDPKRAPYRFLRDLIDRGVYAFSVGSLRVMLMSDADLGTFDHDVVVGIWDEDKFIEGHTIEPDNTHGHGVAHRKPPVIPVYQENWFFSLKGAVITALWVQAHLTATGDLFPLTKPKME